LNKKKGFAGVAIIACILNMLLPFDTTSLELDTNKTLDLQHLDEDLLEEVEQ